MPIEKDETIYIVEIPHQGEPKAWVAKDKDNFCRIMSEANEYTDKCICSSQTGKETIAWHGCRDLDEFKKEYPELDALIDLIEKHGEDKPFYHSDYINDGKFQVEPIDFFDAAKAAVAHDLSSAFVFEGKEEAIAAYNDDRNWARHGGLKAKDALYDQLLIWNNNKG